MIEKTFAEANPTNFKSKMKRTTSNLLNKHIKEKKEPGEVASFVQCEREHEDEHAALKE